MATTLHHHQGRSPSPPINNNNNNNSPRDSLSDNPSEEGYLPELYFPEELDAEEIIRNSTVESYYSDDEADDGSSVTLFHAGYNNNNNKPHSPHSATWDQRVEDPLPTPARAPPISRRPVPSRPPTLPKLESLPEDPHLVTWDQDDPANPHNWPPHRRWTSTILIALYAFIAPMASTMVAPALDTLRDEFDLTSTVEEFLLMSIFLLAFALGPFLWGPLSEVFGRVRVIQGANLIFLLFNTVCGFARSKEQMMAFRFLAGIGGSAPQAIGGGILSDCFKAGERGLATAIYSLMPFLSPAVAPIMGGYMTQYISWRWVFWTTSIFDAVVQLACFIFLRETHHPTILASKCKALKKSTGNPDLHTKWQGPEHTMKKKLMKSCVRPWIMIATQPALQAMALFRGYQYGLMYLVFATFPMVFEDAYDQDVGRASLNYLSLGVGFVIGLQISGRMQDRIYTWCKVHEVDPSSLRNTWLAWKAYRGQDGSPSKLEKGSLLPLTTTTTPEEEGKNNNNNRRHSVARKPVPPMPAPTSQPQRTSTLKRRSTGKSFVDATKGLPEYRLPLVLPFSMLIPIGLLIYGWSAHHRIHWFVPNLGTCIFSIGLIVCFNCAQGYVVDTYTTYAASATGAAAFVRTMAGFGFPLFAPRMYEVLGVGVGNSVLAGVSVTLGLAAPVGLWRYGVWLRGRSTYCVG